MHCCIVLRSPRLGWPHFTTIVDHSTLHFTTLVYHPHLTPDLLVVRQSYFHFQNRDQYGWRGWISYTFISPLTYGGVPVCSCNQQYCQPPSPSCFKIPLLHLFFIPFRIGLNSRPLIFHESPKSFRRPQVYICSLYPKRRQKHIKYNRREKMSKRNRRNAFTQPKKERFSWTLGADYHVSCCSAWSVARK